MYYIAKMEKDSPCIDSQFSKPKKGEEVVITGLSGKFPDSHNVYHFRDNLFAKVDMVSDDHRRWKPFHPEIPQRTGKLFDIEKFDPGFFGITKTQSNHMDPMLRIMLENVYEAIIDAGHNPADFAGTNTAVLIGFFLVSNETNPLYNNQTAFSDLITGYQASMIARRISYYLKLKGRSFVMDAACSSSFFALEEAYNKLLEGKCDKAIVAGANLCLHPFLSLQFLRLGVLSPDGFCKSFDDAANGYVRSEGIVVILLEKAKDAKRIYAEIIHNKTGCDGYKDEGIAYPSSDEQKLFYRYFYKEAQVDPTTLTLLEAHGTGTKVGDLVELNSLEEIFCRVRDTPLFVGSVRSNMGHSELASGLCSLVKMIICMETGFIPPNIHYKQPRKGAKGLEEGTIIVATEKTPLSNDRGLFAINNFGMGGTVAHILLHWNTKSKVNNGLPIDNLPRLICVHGRTEEAVTSILNDVGSRPLDAEHIYLIHQAFRKQIENNLYRGFGIFTKMGEVKRSLKRIDTENPELYLVFGNFDKEWLKLGHQLLELPIFAKTIKRIQNILYEAANIDLYEIFKNPIQENLTNQILGAVAILISLANVLKGIKLIHHRIVGVGSGELVAAYIDNYLTLEQAVLGILSVTSYLSDSSNKKWKTLKTIVPNKKISDSKWIPMDEEKLTQSPIKYFLNSIMDFTNRRNVRQLIPKDAVSLIVGADVDGLSGKVLRLINAKSKNATFHLLSNLGSLYEYGFDIELNKLYPNIELPVGRGTPMLSPLIKWQNLDCYVHKFEEKKTTTKHDLICITPKTDIWKFVVGHVVDGRNLFPTPGYLFLVWESFASITGKHTSDMEVVFEDVKFLRAAIVPIDGTLELTVAIQAGTQTFEIAERGVAIVTGKIYSKTDEQVFPDIPREGFDENMLCMDKKDFYKELRLRGYQYTGLFRSIQKCAVDASQAVIHWDSNWITFLDCLLQLIVFQKDTRNLYVPISIGQLIISAPKHIEICSKYNNMIPVRLYKDLNVLRTEGIELRGLSTNMMRMRKGGDSVLEISKFVPNEAHTDISESIRIFVQIVLENTNALKAKVVEACLHQAENKKLLCPMVKNALDDWPVGIKQYITVLTNKEMEISGISIQNKSLSTEANCLILIVTKVLETTKETVAINVVKGAKGYIISREELDTDLSKFKNSSFKVICSHKNFEEMLVLLRPIKKSVGTISYLDLTNELSNFQWISKLQEQIRNSDEVVIYSQNEDNTGLLGLSTCLQQESYGNKIKSVLIMDEAPKFDPDLQFYKKQLDKDMAINIWQNGAWGTYRHLPLTENQAIESEHIFVKVMTGDDLSTLTWVEGNIKPDDEQSEYDKVLVYVYYSALNYRDLITASGKIPADIVIPNRIKQECVQGLEFVGRNSKGQRIMGLCNTGGLASIVRCDPRFTSEIPEEWTMEDASTVLTVYITVLLAFNGLDLNSNKSILIHSAAGGIGLAAINISIYYGLDIFVTVGTPEKRKFLRRYYPQIQDDHIGNSRDISFETMIHQHTNARGVDYVLNSLTEEKLLASVRCLARGGRFLEIGKFDLVNNNALGLHLLEKNAHFSGVTLDGYFESCSNTIQSLTTQFRELIMKGAIKPLPRTIYKQDEIEQAFRFMSLGKHIGKVVIKMREEEDDKICPVPRTLFKAVPRFLCSPTSSYLICGGLGGFGLELADFLVIRGARNLILTSRSGLSNGYQKYRISIWKNYGVKVLTTALEASTEASCTELLKSANELGPLDGIFNLAIVLKDALFENQTEESFKIPLIPKAYCTKNLDNISRKLCPNLRYFVVFSSTSCGRGNIGQTNYGMANSVMERICEMRKREGYPALAIQWGAIGDVGVLAQMQEDNRELKLAGMRQQKISSCLQLMDKFLKQNEPIVCSMEIADKIFRDGTDNMLDSILNIMGISNLKSVSMHTTFPKLGMDSIMAVEIKQILDENEVFLTPQDLKGMTLSKVMDLSVTRGTETILENPLIQDELPDEINLMLLSIEEDKSSFVRVLKMKTLVEDKEVAPHIFLLPGLEGTAAALEPLCEKLKVHASCLQFCPDIKTESITQLASSILPYVDTVTEDLTILAYSFGCVVGLELLHMLEERGKQARVIYLDSSPEILVQMIKSYFPNDDENVFQTIILSSLIMCYVPYDSVLNYQKHFMKLNTFQEKINYMLDVAPFSVNISSKYIRELCISVYERLSALYKYKLKEGKLKSHVTLFKASLASLANAAPDYGLSNIFENLEDIVTVEGNHITILKNEELAKEINKILSVV